MFKTKVVSWYVTTMDRVSGWYKRRTAWVTLVLGAVIAVLLNVDAVLVMRGFSVDPALRSAVAADARSAAATPATSAADAVMNYTITYQRLNALALPIGWTSPVSAEASGPNDPAVTDYRIRPDFRALVFFDGRAWALFGRTVLSHAFGWLLTAVAASLGAPFWFDLLGKFVNIRQTGTRPDPGRAG